MKVLFVHPNNFLKGGQGENNRVNELLSICCELGAEVDLFSFEHFSADSSFQNYQEDNKDGRIHNLFLYDYQKGYGSDQVKHYTNLVRIKRKILRMIENKRKHKYLQDWTRPGMHELFEKIIQNNTYDIIIIFYTYYATLLENKKILSKKVYFMEDSMFLQQYLWDEKKNKKSNITMGKLMDEELKRMKVFDEFFCISNDERIFYEKVTGKQMHFLPHLLSENIKKVTKPIEKRKWDILFIGFENPFNVEGLEWFLDKVYPKLKKELNIVMVGSAGNKLKVKYENIDIIPFAPNLDEIFENAKVSICPMFHGTGMKVKVIESMARGLPVVCNERGVDGMPDKNLCGCLVTQEADKFAEYIEKLIYDKRYYEKQVAQVNNYYEQVFNRKFYMEELRRLLI